MKKYALVKLLIFGLGCIFLLVGIIACNGPEQNIDPDQAYKIIFLHHSTGNVIWKGKPRGWDVIRNMFYEVHTVPTWFAKYNSENDNKYFIEERTFPKAEPYGWANYPYDYYNIWVKNSGSLTYMEEPTLENLTRDYDMVIFKHCFPVSLVEEDTGNPDIDSNEKRVENYKLQYKALKEKMHQFPDTRFLLWTSAAMVEGKTTPEQAARAKTFVEWVTKTWDEPGDNIYLWDFYSLETEGGIYLTPENARGEWDSHPSKSFAAHVAPLFCNRIVDVNENNGNATTLAGKKY